MSNPERVRIAMIGCGAVAGAHLPIVSESDDAEATVLVDKSLARANELAQAHGIVATLDDYRKVAGKADAAIVALPHHLHAPVSTELLEMGLHVMVEKPMALTTEECDRMIAASEKAGKVLAVGHLRRFFHSSRFIKRAVESGLLGEIVSFDAREGAIYNWPAASDFTFRADAGGGVLSDQGAHTLDTLLWWLGDYEELRYFDDAEGGVEADCEIHMTLRNGAKGIVELSRTRDLRATVIIRGERGQIEVESKFDSQIRLTLDGEPTLLQGRAMTDAWPEEDVNDIFRRQLAEFVAAIRENRPPLVSGPEARKAVAAIEACRKVREPLDLPWRAITT